MIMKQRDKNCIYCSALNVVIPSQMTLTVASFGYSCFHSTFGLCGMIV